MVLSGPRSPQTKACVSMTTLRWDPLLAIDSSQSALSAEGGSGDKERLNSICCEWLLAPHVNGINRLHSGLHRSEAQKGRKEAQELCCRSPRLVPRDETITWLCSLFAFYFVSLQVFFFLLEESSG